MTNQTDAALTRIEKRRVSAPAAVPMADRWKAQPQYSPVVKLFEKRTQPVTLQGVHATSETVTRTLMAVRKELQVDDPAKLLRHAYEFLSPARSFVKDRAISMEELSRLRMKSAAWQKWSATAKTSDDRKSEPVRLERQLRFIEHVGIENAFDLIDLIETIVPAGGPRRFGIAYTPEANVEFLRKLASGTSLRDMAASLGGGNSPAPTHGAVRDRRDDLWKHIAAQLDGLMPRKAPPKREYKKNPNRTQQFWRQQSVDDADLMNVSNPDWRPRAGDILNADLQNMQANTHEFFIRNWK